MKPALHLVPDDASSVEASTGRKALSMKEVADLLGVSYQSVRKLVRDGRLKSVQVGCLKLIPAARLDEFLAGVE